MDNGNYWIATGYDHDEIVGQDKDIDGIQFGYGFLSSASLRDSTCKKHVAQIIFMSDYQSWKNWEAQPWLNRGQQYDERKEQIAKHAIALMDRQLPGFSDLVDYFEVSTPLSVESCAGHCGGAIYGVPATPDRFHAGGFHAQTSIKNLMLSGSDLGTFGIVGAMMSGLMASSRAIGALGMFMVMRDVKKAARRRNPKRGAESETPVVAMVE
jgi:hypothetical protein